MSSANRVVYSSVVTECNGQSSPFGAQLWAGTTYDNLRMRFSGNRGQVERGNCALSQKFEVFREPGIPGFGGRLRSGQVSVESFDDHLLEMVNSVFGKLGFVVIYNKSTLIVAFGP